MARWQTTFRQYQQGRAVFWELPRATAYRHRAIILRARGVDIKERNFDSFQQEHCK